MVFEIERSGGTHLEFNYMPNMSKIFENNNVIELTEAINYDILFTIDGKTKDWKDIKGLKIE